MDDVLTRYEQAKDLFMKLYLSHEIKNDALYPHWVDDDRFYYRRKIKGGWEYRLVDVPAKSHTPAFDHEALAQALENATGQAFDPKRLAFESLALESSSTITFDLFDRHWSYKAGAGCEELGSAAINKGEMDAPDGQTIAFVRDHNLWVRDSKTGAERALTTDGTADYRYSSRHLHDLMPEFEGVWSPDSRYLFTFQLDTRGIPPLKAMRLADDKPGWQALDQIPMSTTNSPHRESYRLVVFDVVAGRAQDVEHTNLINNFFGGLARGIFTGRLGWWAADSRHAYFVDSKPGAKTVCVVELDPTTGNTRRLFAEHSQTFVKLRNGLETEHKFLPLRESDELAWYSERSGWGHLYLYDLKTGKLKNPITEGDWLVRDVLHYNPKARELLICTAGRDPEINPYYRDICKVNIDTGELTPLTTGDFDHVVADPVGGNERKLMMVGTEHHGLSGVSPGGKHIVFTKARVDTAPDSLAIDREGGTPLPLETADVSALPKNWVWPEPFKAKADDGKTDVYGVIFRPPGFSPKQTYPVWDFSNSFRNYSTMPVTSFETSTWYGLVYAQAAAIAALGFIVITMEGRATPLRDKAFQDHAHGDFSAANELKDHIAAIRQLGERYPYMDVERVGISGLEGISNIVFSVLKYPDFFKVAVVNMQEDIYDGFPRSYVEDWYGTSDPDVRHLKVQPADCVDTFDGKLLLIHEIAGISIASTFKLIDALQKANKDFDELIVPYLGNKISNYTTRREWDYMIEHLRGETPPKNFALTKGEDLAMVDYFELAKKKAAFLESRGSDMKGMDKYLIQAGQELHGLETTTRSTPNG